jgi:hypothetical protein
MTGLSPATESTMDDNLFYALITALIAAMAIGASTAEAKAHLFPGRTAHATTAQPQPATPEVIMLPRVEVIGHRHPATDGR